MIVDATALPEQVADDVAPPPFVRPASAARRCACSTCRRTSPTVCWR
jgi:delta 1-pyrroline-5-carboxylate dehydrogenase